MSDIIQWSAIIVILAIVAVTIVRKILRFRRALRNPDSCACSCTGCPVPCSKRHTPQTPTKKK